MTSNARKNYFPGLNGLRFLAASAVVYHHTEQFKSLFGWPNHWMRPYVRLMGGTAVTFFFVLSGFLITHLLWEEKRVTHTIDVSRFYLKRGLRIWPLYFFIVSLALMVYPGIGFLRVGEGFDNLGSFFGVKLLLFALVMPNVAISLFPPVPFAAHSWSIGTEEQFYLLWPWVMKAFRHPLVGIILVISGYLVVKIAVNAFIPTEVSLWGLAPSFLHSLVDATRIDCMAIGAVGAWVHSLGSSRISAVARHPLLQGITYIGLAWSLGTSHTYLVGGINFSSEVYSLYFLILIYNVPRFGRALGLEWKPINYLGNISYGIYMFHPVAIVLAIRAIQYSGANTKASLTGRLLLPLLAFGLTTGLSALSYRYFEGFFLGLKSRLLTERISVVPAR